MGDLNSLLPLIYNGALLVALAVLYDALALPIAGSPSRGQQVLLGLSVGGIGLLVMLTPWRFSDGVVFDTRSVLLSTSGLFFGALPTAMAMAMTAALRIYQGGAGAATGVAVILATGSIGLLWRFRRKPDLANLSWGELYLFGIAVQAVLLLMMLTLPGGIGQTVLATITLPVMLIYPVATALLGRLFVNRLRRSSMDAALTASEERYRSYLENAPYGVFVADETGRFVEANPAASEISGYSLAELRQMQLLNFLPPESRALGEAHFRQVVATGRANGDVPFQRKNGSKGWWSVAAVRISPTRFLGFTVDITATKQAEDALRQSEERFRHVASSISDVAFSCVARPGEPYRLEWLTGGVERLTGYSVDAVLAMGCWGELVVAEDQATFTAHIAELAVGANSACELRLRHRTGAIVWVTATAECVAEEPVLRLYGALADITARKQTEARYQTLFSEMLDGFALHEIICDAEGRPVDYRFLAVNPAFERMTGLQADAVVGQTIQSVLPDTESHWIETYGRVALTGEPALFQNYARSLGQYFEVTAFSPAPGQFATIFVDVTERRRAEQALARRDALLEAVSFAADRFLQAGDWEQEIHDVLARLGNAAQVSRVYIFQNETRADGELVTSQRHEWCAPGVTPQANNPALQQGSFQELGFARWAEILSRGELIRAHTRDLPASEQEFMAAQEVKSLVEVPIHVDKRWWGFAGFEHCDQEYEWSEAEIGSLRVAGHVLSAIIKNQEFQEQLRTQASRMAQIMQSVGDGMLLVDKNGEVLMANQPARTYLELLTGESDCHHLSRLGDLSLASLLAASRQPGQSHRVQVQHRTFDLAAHPVESDAAAGACVLVLRDITDGLAAQQQFQRQERLAAIGQLAAGIAHDFNNLMSVIILYAQLTAQSTAMGERERERLAIIQRQGQRGADMIRQILDFSRRAVLDRQPVDLLPLLKEQAKLLMRTLPEHIVLRFDYQPGEYVVRADPTRIEQVIMNLAVNARDAMPEGGHLTIVLDRIQVAVEHDAPLHGMKPGSWVRLAVTDTGVGISLEDLEHIFEPFFTTKPVGLGTGLGLAQVHGIIAQHDGHITVTSRPGAGATFTIYLPEPDLVRADATFEPQTSQLVTGQGETILLAEDEPNLRKTLVELLEMWNYRVVAVANGQEALAMLDRLNGAVDLIISDVVMPEMTGIALFKALHQRQASVPLILLTGHPMNDELNNLRRFGLHAWLPKPPVAEQLAATIAAGLARGHEMKQRKEG